MADEDVKREWVHRVLGIDLSAADRPAGGPGAKLLQVWIGAKEEVDTGISKLQDALRAAGDEDLDQIVEYGLFGATEGETVQLMAALREAANAGAGPFPKILSAVEDYRDFLEGAPIVDLLEDNPFGVSVPLRKRLGAALNELERLAA